MLTKAAWGMGGLTAHTRYGVGWMAMLMLEMGNPSTSKRLVGGYSMSGFLGFGSFI